MGCIYDNMGMVLGRVLFGYRHSKDRVIVFWDRK